MYSQQNTILTVNTRTAELYYNW